MLLELLAQKLLLLALHLEDGNNFPPPLSAQEERNYVKQMQQGDPKAREKLIEHNLRLVAHIVKRYYSSNIENDELISVGTVGLIKAINTYDPIKGVRLSTYASRCIDNEILMFFRAKKKTAMDVSFDDPIDQDSEGNPLTLMDVIAADDTIVEDIALKNDLKALRIYLNEMEEGREKTVLFLRYGLSGKPPMTQNEVAKLFGISRSYVSRIETKALKKLRKRFQY